MKIAMSDVRYPDEAIDLGLGCKMRVTYGTTRSGFDIFCDDLIASDNYQLVQRNEIGCNAYVTLNSEDGMLHLYYTEATGSVRIISDTLEKSVLPVMEPKTPREKVTDSALCVMSLDYSHREILDGNGMSYVVILEDGRFIIIDGGYRSDAENLYKFLRDNNCRADGKIVIAAWILTHSHSDHVGALNEFADRFADKVTLELLICNPTQAFVFRKENQYNSYMTEKLPDVLAKFGAVRSYRPHSGQRIRFCDAEFEILYTYEDFFPAKLPYMNDSSTVFRLTLGGQTVLFMGDCENLSTNLICDMYGGALKSDILQINHHGYSGGTVELYELVDPCYSMWTTSRPAFDLRITGEKYQWIGNALKSNKYIADAMGVDHCLVADGPCKILRMPLRSDADISYYEFPAD
jgi:beta-lactamase superfamily II metal-dependent hydrolase